MASNDAGEITRSDIATRVKWLICELLPQWVLTGAQHHP
jgi:hypothetical protein